MDTLGIDIGGTGIKGAPVNPHSGSLTADRFRVDTPQPATPDTVSIAVRKVCDAFPELTGPIGCTFPAIIDLGVVRSAANIDEAWIGVDAAAVLEDACGRPVEIINDADAAGLAEAKVGAAAGVTGVVLVLTFGTGIGSAVFIDGVLVPNTELGHVEIDGAVAESFASSKVRKDADLSFAEWSVSVNRYLAHLERLLSPQRIVIGGGVSKKFDRYGHLLETRAEVVPATLRNEAGIVGAAVNAAGA